MLPPASCPRVPFAFSIAFASAVGVYVVFGSIALASADHEKGFLNGMRVLALYLCGFVSITTTPRCGARTRSGNPPVANNAERALPDTWRDGAGRTEG